EVGVDSMNFGGPAGAGVKYLIARAFLESKSGDTIVLALERHFLTEEGRSKSTQLGVAFAVDAGKPLLADGHPVFQCDFDVSHSINMFRPGARFVATLVGKKLSGRPMYRYDLNDLRKGGRLDTDYRDQWKTA